MNKKVTTFVSVILLICIVFLSSEYFKLNNRNGVLGKNLIGLINKERFYSKLSEGGVFKRIDGKECYVFFSSTGVKTTYYFE